MSFGPRENFLEPLKVKKYLQNRWFWHIFEPYGFCRLTISGSMKSSKSTLPYVWICKVRTKCCGMLPFISADSYDPNEACQHICWVVECIRKFFETLKGKGLVHQNTPFELLWMHLMDFAFERGMKTEKSLSSYV